MVTHAQTALLPISLQIARSSGNEGEFSAYIDTLPRWHTAANQIVDFLHLSSMNAITRMTCMSKEVGMQKVVWQEAVRQDV